MERDIQGEGTQAVEKLLTVKEAAELLQVSERTIWRLMDSGKLTYILVGAKARRFRAEDLENYIQGSARTGRIERTDGTDTEEE